MPPDREEFDRWRFATVGLELAGTLGVLVAIGWWADGKLGSSPVGVLIGAFIGIVGGLTKLVYSTRNAVRPPDTDIDTDTETDTDTAAITAPRPSRTGADTLATPGSRSPALWAHPRLRTSASDRSVNFAEVSTACCVAVSA